MSKKAKTTKPEVKKSSKLKDLLIEARSETSDPKLREMLGAIINHLDQPPL